MSLAYERLLTNYEQSADAAHSEAEIALAALKGVWLEQARKDRGDIADIERKTSEFYSGNSDLFATVNNTTGDTPKQLQDFYDFVDHYGTEFADGKVIDVGCGDGLRITSPMAQALPDAKIIGIDIRPPAPDVNPRVVFRKGDICNLDDEPNKEAQLVTAHWSVVNDLLARSQQLRAFSEVARVLSPGGLFYFDVPSLEGKGGYEVQARQYASTNPGELFGRMQRTFPGNRTKQFHIYPFTELKAMLDLHGFNVEQQTLWNTKMGQARRTIVARLVSAP